MSARRGGHEALTALRVAETIFAGCVLGLLITRPRWGLHALELLSGHGGDADGPPAPDDHETREPPAASQRRH